MDKNKLMKRDLTEGLNSLSGNFNINDEINVITKTLTKYMPDMDWVEVLNRDDITYLITNSKSRDSLIESIVNSFYGKNAKMVLNEGILNGGEKKEYTREELRQLEKELYDFLKKNGIYPEDGTFDNASNPLYDLDLSLLISGDWKHDHLYTEGLVEDFCKQKGLIIIRHDVEEVGDSDSDDYDGWHYWKIDTAGEGAEEKLNAFRTFFGESKERDEDEPNMLFVVYKDDKGDKVGDYVEYDIDRDAFIDSLKEDENVLGIYDSCTNVGPIGVIWERDSLDEDTVKQGKHWVNKGKEGTHGKFKTKKAADAQRKAMFARGFKEASLKEAHNDSKTKDEKIVNGYVIGKFANGGYSVYDNKGHFEEDKNNGYKTEAEAIKRAESLPKGIAVEESLKEDKKSRFVVYVPSQNGYIMEDEITASKKYASIFDDNNKKSLDTLKYLLKVLGLKKSEIKKDYEDVTEYMDLEEGYYGETLYDFFETCADSSAIDKVQLWTDDVVYDGPYDEIPEDLLNAEFIEFDTDDKLVVNVDSTEEYGYGIYEFLDEFLDDCNSDMIEVYDLGTGETIYSGYKDECPDEVLEMAFESFDAPNQISCNIEGDDLDESCKGKHCKGKNTKQLKEEYGPYKDEDFCLDIADALEYGNYCGTVTVPEIWESLDWDLAIHGIDYFDCDAFYEKLLADISYPVRDGHLSYTGLDEFISREFVEELDFEELKKDFDNLGYGEDFEEWFNSDEDEFEFWIDYDIEFDVDEYERLRDEAFAEDDEDDEDIDESLKEAFEGEITTVEELLPFKENKVKLALKEEDIDKIKNSIKTNPNYGDPIQGCPGARKLRISLGAKGKRGGARIIYVNIYVDKTAYLIDVYAKKNKEDLSSADKKLINTIIDLLKNKRG